MEEIVELQRRLDNLTPSLAKKVFFFLIRT